MAELNQQGIGRDTAQSCGPVAEDTKIILSEISTNVCDESQGPTRNEQEVDTENNRDSPKFVTGYKLLLAMAALNLSAILINLDLSILSTAMPTITDEFRSLKDIGWYVSSYQLAVSALQPMTGKVFTYFSNKWAFIVFLVLFEVGSLICGLASSSIQFIGGRTISGIGASGIFNGSMIILYGMVSPLQRPTFMGVMIAISQVGLIAGPLIGGSLTQYSTWRWCFWINLPVGGCACILLVLIHIPEHMVKPKLTAVVTDRNILKKLDVVGSIILVGAVVQLLLALHFGGDERSWNSPTIIGLFCGFAAATILFVGWEYRAAENALMPLGIFQNRFLACAIMMNLCLYGSTYIATYFIPIYFQSILGDSPMMSGVHMLPSIIGSIIFTALSGIIVSKAGCSACAVFAAMLISVGSGLMTTWSTNTTTGQWIGHQVLYGCGRGLGMQMAIVAIQAKLPPSLVAIGLTMLIFIQGLGASVVVSLGNTVLDRTIMSEIKRNAPKLDPKDILNAGATAFRSQVPMEDLPIVVNSWALGFQKTMYIGTGLAVAIFVLAWGLGFKDVWRNDPEVDRRANDKPM